MIRLAERVDRRTLTVNERALLHIFERSANKDLADAPFALTQQGIARALRIRVNHVSRAVKTLEAQHCLTEAIARVRGEVRKRKVYLISHEGHAAAQALTSELSRALVTVRDEKGATRELAMGEARRLSGGPFTFTDILSNMDPDGVLDVGKLLPGRESPTMSHQEDGRPRGDAFYGRLREVDVIQEWTSSPTPALLILGPRGIGKSSLASKALGILQPERHILWHTVREGGRPDALVRSIASFLSSIGRGELSARSLERSLRAEELEPSLLRDWPASNGIFVLDDADQAPPDVTRMLIEVMRRRAGKLVLIAEAPIPELGHLRASGALEVLPVGGLEKQDCRRLASKGMSNEEFDKIYRLSGGNPLSIKLLSADALEGLDTRFTPEERALLKVLKLRQESD
jgi:DNA-binding MarR family transcriptional regulator/energy-coupling factor transporter ATP-binding protein EcfA2